MKQEDVVLTVSPEADLLAKLAAFKMAAVELQAAWEAVSIENPANEVLTASYPFHEDFVDVTHRIMAWEEAAK